MKNIKNISKFFLIFSVCQDFFWQTVYDENMNIQPNNQPFYSTPFHYKFFRFFKLEKLCCCCCCCCCWCCWFDDEFDVLALHYTIIFLFSLEDMLLFSSCCFASPRFIYLISVFSVIFLFIFFFFVVLNFPFFFFVIFCFWNLFHSFILV